MIKKFILGLLTTLLISHSATVFALYDSELNKRLVSCTPTKNYKAGSTVYQISGLTGSVCIFKIENTGNKPTLICKVPKTKMPEMASFNPLIVQNIKNQYCVISLKRPERATGIYY